MKSVAELTWCLFQIEREIDQENVYFSLYSEIEDVPKCPTHPFPL